MIVHDLRNPLMVIFGFLQILECDEIHQLSPNTQALARTARRGSEELIAMISSILDVSKMEAGAMSLRSEACDLNALIHAVWVSSQPLPDHCTVTLGLPEAPISIMADAGLIRRVLQNLLSNALKHSPTGGDVRIVVTPLASEVRIAITDTGPGIAPEYHHRIFEKFGQLEDRKKRLGTGLGLAFCKLAIEAHGGRIGVESEVGKGSTFWLALPRPENSP
jgi:signal transduction histidine kinase